MITLPVSIIWILVIKYLVHLSKNNKIRSKYQPFFLSSLKKWEQIFFSPLIDTSAPLMPTRTKSLLHVMHGYPTAQGPQIDQPP
jgi:hypothetical protein